jgi:hypothetical protein
MPQFPQGGIDADLAKAGVMVIQKASPLFTE